MTDPLSELRSTVEAAAALIRDGADGEQLGLERPREPRFGDYSTNAALLLAPAVGEQPRGIAERLAEEVGQRLGDRLDRVEVAGPGFLNLFLSDGWYRQSLAAMIQAGEGFGCAAAEDGISILVEFVSANPTGPLTAAGGRHAAYGDAVARILSCAGHEVTREYYVNDVGGQINRFAGSIAARMRGQEPPEDGYGGAYIEDLAERLRAAGVGHDELDALAQRGAELALESIRQTLERFNVSFDSWYSERSLHRSKALEDTLEALRASGQVYESEDAIWLRTSSLGDDKDRVLIRSAGEPTYFMADIAYHRDKLARGHQLLIDVLGADHHGYVARMRAALAALGEDPERLEMPIMQLVHIIEGGERAQMSKRTGEFVSLDELIGDIGADAARFFMLQRSHETTVDLDLELARRQSNENPVYYVQYAHARIASILRKAAEGGNGAASSADAVAAIPVEPAERALIKRLLELPEEVSEAAARRAPHRLCAYAMATAADFHAFYRDCKVIGAEGEGVEGARLVLCRVTMRTIARTLDLLGISAPERM